MGKETKSLSSDAQSIVAELMTTFEAYKQANDQRLAEIEAKGASDPLLQEKLEKIDRRLDALSLKSVRNIEGEPAAAGRDPDQAWIRYMRSGDESGLSRLDTKALSAGTADQGGYVAPPELDRMIEARLRQSSPMRQIATIKQTTAGVYRKPVSLGIEAEWASETETRTESTTSGLSLLEFSAGDLYAMPAATQTLLEDTYADIDEWLADEVDASFSVQESRAFIVGNGLNKPQGILDYPLVPEASHVWGRIGTVAGDFSVDDASDQLIDLIYTPQSQFRANGRFLMNRKTTATVRKLKDSDGRYLWAPGTAGEASTILGYPVVEIEDMPDIGQNQPAIAFGDFRRGYLIADRQGARVLRDPFSAKPYVLFYTTKRVGGGVQNFDAFKVMMF